ncbi:MAG TPA: transporter substrate-binding domain-containing protein [Cryomorphaceae bacterium]|nr:transporter substrate-binding domain-containing protein [Cryomorphaceae bacterium]
MNSFLKIFLLAVFTVTAINSGFGQTLETLKDTSSAESAPKTLKVGYKISEPFTILDGEEVSGLSVQLWHRIAQELGTEYEYVKYPNLDALFAGLNNGEVDISINPLTVTRERLKIVEFTQPFFITTLAIAVPNNKENAILSFAKGFFSWQFFTAIGFLALVILVFGLVTWFFERKHNSEEFPNSLAGLWEGFWWSAVTMTTVGYGDKSPRTTGGRIVGLIWMFAAIIIISGFTASIASSLTLNELELDVSTVDDLRKAKVYTVKGSSAENYLANAKIAYQTVLTTSDGINLLKAGKADAFVDDEPLIRYDLVNRNLTEDIAIAPSKFFTQYYAFAINRQSNRLIRPINLALIEAIREQEWKAALGQYQLE